jgi:hypothetical protein
MRIPEYLDRLIYRKEVSKWFPSDNKKPISLFAEMGSGFLEFSQSTCENSAASALSVQELRHHQRPRVVMSRVDICDRVWLGRREVVKKGRMNAFSPVVW